MPILLIITTTLLITAISICILHNFPWILKRSIPVYNLKLSHRHIPILMVSDLHIDDDRSVWSQILRIASKHQFKVLIIAGDLINRKAAFSEKVLEVLEKLAIRDIEIVIYVPSSSSHDIKPLPRFPIERRTDTKTVYLVPYMLRLSIDSCSENVYITHGDYASRNGVVAHLLELISLKMFSKPFIGSILRRTLGVENGDWVVYGHTHTPIYSKRYRAIGIGCWIDRPHELLRRAIAVAVCRGRSLEIRLITL